MGNVKKNTFSALMLQIVTAISGLILPQLFIRTYGSTMNGMVTSVSQFISYLSLVEAGIGAASIAALYRPLEEKNHSLINKILSTTKKFYLKAGVIFVLLLIALLIFYPLLSSSQIDYETTIWMILILSISALTDYFIIGKYRVLLTADQKYYIITFCQIIAQLLNLLITILLIYLNLDIIIVKGISTLVYISRFIFIIWYVKKRYTYLNFKADTDDMLISQKWDAFIHQLAGLVVVNSGVVLLTVFGYDFADISVFTIYNMIITVLNNLLISFYNALAPTFGNIIAKKDLVLLKKSFREYELFFFIILFSVVATYLLLIIPFMSLYTQGITDAQYIRFDYALAGAGVIIGFNLYNPAMTVINAAGHYKETKKFSLNCAIINIIVSIISIVLFGPIGIFIAEICSQLYIDYSFIKYNGLHIIKDKLILTLKRLMRFLMIFVSICIFYMFNYQLFYTNSFIIWIMYGIILFFSFVIINLLASLIFEKLLKKVNKVISRKV